MPEGRSVRWRGRGALQAQRAAQRPLPPARRTALSPQRAAGPTWGPAGVSLAAMLDLGVCRWGHIVLGISTRSHVDAATLRRALERTDAAWQGEEHMAKLSVNVMIGLWARSTEVVYSARSSSASELDGAGADFSQAFAYEGAWCGTSSTPGARRILDAPPRYLAQVKTDCLLTQRLPKCFTERLRVLEALRHPDGTPVYRVEETNWAAAGRRAGRRSAPNNGGGTGWTTPWATAWRATPCCSRATGKTHLAEPGPGGADALGAQVRARGQRAKAGLAGGGGDHAAGHDALGGPGLRGTERRREVPAAGRLPAVAGRAGLLGRAAHQRAVGARRRAQARAHAEHALRPRHLQLREVAAGRRRGGVPKAGAGQGEAEGALPLQARPKPGWPDTTLVISHSKRMAVNAAANRALAPEGSKLLELEVIHIDLGCYESTPRNSPQSMRVWPGLRLIGAGGKLPKGLCGRGGSGAGRSEAGQRHAAEGAAVGHLPGAHPPQPRPPGPGVLPPHAAPLGASRATSSELLEAGLERAARRLQRLQHEVAHLKEHAPLPFLVFSDTAQKTCKNMEKCAFSIGGSLVRNAQPLRKLLRGRARNLLAQRSRNAVEQLA